MKKTYFAIFASAILFVSMCPSLPILTREGKTTIINTTSLTQKVEGYNGTTPLKIFIKNNKIVRIETLPNQESPKYFSKVQKQLIGKWNGMSVDKAIKTEIDGVTGATYSSNAVKENVRKGLEYYRKHKK